MTMENIKEYVLKVQFTEDDKQPSKAGMICTIDGGTINGDTFFLVTKNTWIGDHGALCHIRIDDTCLFDINKLIQGSSRIISATKKGKL